MICKSCEEFERILDLEKNLAKTYTQIFIDFKEYASLNGVECICDNCQNVIRKGEYYFEDENIIDEIINDVQQEIAEIVMNDIEACELCGHGAEMIDLRYAMEDLYDDEDEDADEEFNKIDYSTELQDLIYEVCDFDEEISEGAMEYISCPNCKAGSGQDYEDKIDYGEWDLCTTVYTKENIEDFNEAFYGEKKTYEYINQEINYIAQVCSFQDIVDLKNDYLKNPLMVNNKSLNKIVELVNDLYTRNKAFIMDEFYVMYRARVSKTNTTFCKDEMWEPPIEYVPHGRYNPVGFPVLYLANSKEVIRKEVKKKADEQYNIGVFKIENQLKLFKINSVFTGEFEGFINEEVPTNQQNLNFKVQYIITNIMAMVIKNVGFNGVVYLSTKSPEYINVAILNYKKNKDISILEVVQEL